MSQAVVRGGSDTFADSTRPDLEYGTSKYLRLKSASKEVFLYLRNPAPRGAKVLSATLRVYARGASSGTRTLTVSRTSTQWSVRRLNWTNRPGVRTTDAVTTSIGTLADGTPIDINVTAHLSTFTNGTSNFGWKIATSTTTEHSLYGFDAGVYKPQLTVVWSDAPSAPTRLSPSNAVVGIATPLLTFDYTDVAGSTELGAVQVQVDTAKSTTNPLFDSGQVTASVAEFDLASASSRTLTVQTVSASTAITSTATLFEKADIGEPITATGIPANATITAVTGTAVADPDSGVLRYPGATLSIAATTSQSSTGTITRTYNGLANNATTNWRVRLMDMGGKWSGWSAWTAITRIDKPVLTVSSPSSATPVVTEATPPILWSYAGQAQYQVIIMDAKGRKKIYDSLVRNGSASSLTIPPKKLVDPSATYMLIVNAWDSRNDREGSPNDPTFSQVVRNFTTTTDGTVTAVTSVTAAQVGVTPKVTVSWSRATAPDSWTVSRDGLVIGSLLLPVDTLVSGSTYSMIDYGADPFKPHTYTVQAVVNGKTSGKATSPAFTPKSEGIWLMDPDTDTLVALWGDDGGSWDVEDDAATYTPVGATEPMRIISGMGALTGSLSGTLTDGWGKTSAQQEADLYTLKSSPANTLRLVVGDMNLQALVGDIKISPMSVSRAGQVYKDVSFNFWQRGELAFTPNL